MNLFSDHRVTMVFGAVVAVTAAIYVVLGGPSTEAPLRSGGRKRRSKRSGKMSSGSPRGLHNSGNTCFVNAVLQAIASCASVERFLEEEEDPERSPLRSALLGVVRAVNGQEVDEEADGVGDPEVWAPAGLFSALRGHGWVISSGEQDALEFFQVLFSTLEEEVEAGKQRAASSPLDVDEEPSSVSSGVVLRNGTELPLGAVRKQARTSLAAKTPFSGTLTNKLSFRASGQSKSPTSSVVFNNITLTLPATTAEDTVPVETLLRMFVSKELVDDDDLFKQLTFARLPECLCFHVQRTAFETETGVTFKRQDAVVFPAVLNMDAYAYNRQQVGGGGAALPEATSHNNNYLLKAVVVHLGGINSGHYVTYREEPSRARWFYSSDSLVKEVALDEVLKANPYMLFYEKIHATREDPKASGDGDEA